MNTDYGDYAGWHAAWGEQIAKEPTKPCRCGGTMAQHHWTCPIYPPYGYDHTGEPHKESQAGKAIFELGRRMAERRNAIILDALGVCK